ncbi:MAG: pilus assembly protein N-terminal domain-containing protein, partial [Verrucomicrobiae bacterium]|nr:pilus assembly protein N-terminal domain-containing protein [Verrucomicrobiae bacterium]
MTNRFRNNCFSISVACALAGCVWVWAALQADAATPVQVSVGEAVTLKAANVTKLAIADDTIADVVPLSETEISVIGKKAGVTTLTVVYGDGRATDHYRVEVGLSAGVRSIHEALEVPGVRVREIGDAIILEGKVQTEQEAERIVKIAGAYKANVVNLIEVLNPRQVRIRTRIVEVRTDAIKQLGVQYFGPNGEVVYRFGFGQVEGGSLLGSGFFDPLAQGQQTISLGTVPAAVEARLRALASRDAARILSEPTLVTLSGREASFLAGGEVPIVQQLAQTFTVEFKEFGVRMKIK